MTRSRIQTIALTLFAGVAGLLFGLAVVPMVSITAAPAFSEQLAQRVDEPTNASYSDDELKSFADAALEVNHIKESYLPKMAAADDEQEQEQLKQAAIKEMTRAVEQRGLKIDKYQEILAAALTRPELAQRVGKYLSQPRAWV
ncbi:MAG TPA: DUF4168 domain-containing protein [Casimicrobiaceae bacterium]|nr:DUF4168 domain-containing protein [Casimicrobiaceae bacterium]